MKDYQGKMNEINASGACDVGGDAIASATKALQSTTSALPELQERRMGATRTNPSV